MARTFLKPLSLSFSPSPLFSSVSLSLALSPAARHLPLLSTSRIDRRPRKVSALFPPPVLSTFPSSPSATATPPFCPLAFSRRQILKSIEFPVGQTAKLPPNNSVVGFSTSCSEILPCSRPAFYSWKNPNMCDVNNKRSSAPGHSRAICDGNPFSCDSRPNRRFGRVWRIFVDISPKRKSPRVLWNLSLKNSSAHRRWIRNKIRL